MYQVIVTRPAQKQFKKIDVRYQKIIEQRFRELEKNPLLGKKLHDNLSQYRSIREGAYRIVYEVKAKVLLVFIVAVDHRQSVYKKLK